MDWDTDVLADITRYVGAGVAIVGAFVVSPEGTALLFHQGAHHGKRAIRWVHLRLARWVPWLRRDVTVFAQAASGYARGGGAVVGTATGHAWLPDASVDEKIALLRKRIADVDDRVGKAEQLISQERQERTEAITALAAELRESRDDLRRQIASFEARTVLTDARALPVVGIGVILTGIPEDIARLPPALWAALLVLCSGLATTAAWSALRERRRTQVPS